MPGCADSTRHIGLFARKRSPGELRPMTTQVPNPFWQLPQAPQPPHDPTFWLLNSEAGWHNAELQNDTLATGELALEVVPGSGRVLNEPSGSFGGLTVPGNVALSGDGSIWLLDTKEE